MTRKKTVKPSPAEVMARLLRDAYLAAYCKHNIYHDSPSWAEVKKLVYGQAWQQIAEEALALGLRAPLGAREEVIDDGAGMDDE